MPINLTFQTTRRYARLPFGWSAGDVPKPAQEPVKVIKDKLPGDPPGPFGPSGKNRLIQGVGNGVYAIVNNAELRIHAQSHCLKIVERKLPENEVPEELKKLSEVRKRYASGAADDPFVMMIGELIAEAEKIVKNESVNSEAAIARLAVEFYNGQTTLIATLEEKVASLRNKIRDVSASLRQKIDDHLRDQRYRELDVLDGQIGSMRDFLRRRNAFVADIQALIERVLTWLQAHGSAEEKAGELHVAENLSWTEIQTFFARGARGFILDSRQIGSVNHPFIFSHEAGIPLVTIDDPLGKVTLSYTVSIDSRTGQVIINPTDTTIQQLELRRKSYAELEKLFKQYADVHQTLDGAPIPALQFNIKDRSDFAHIKGGEVGLFRTEGLYAKTRPTPEYLVRAFKDVIRRSALINVRLFDADFDKIPDFFTREDIDEFCQSMKGLDFLLKSGIGRSIVIDQIKALLIAYDRLLHDGKTDMGQKKIRVLIPMITNPAEVREIKKLIAEVEQELLEGKQIKGAVADRIETAIMVETSAAVANIEALAREVDAFSIGGNDLTKDLLGFGERKKLMTGKEYDWLSPAVLSNIKKVIDVAKEAGIPVGFCGEMARDPMGAILLVLLGIDTLSMDGSYIKEINYVLANIHLREWEKFSRIDPEGLSVIDRVFAQEDALQVREFLYELITQKSHADTQLSLSKVVLSARPLSYQE